MGMFKKATKEQLKATAVLIGGAGSGKTLTAIIWARRLAGPDGRICVIDTEHRSASKYVGQVFDGVPIQFDVCELEYYSPSTYTNVIKEAGREGYDCIVIDSLTHAWDGVGGALDTVDKKASAAGSSGGSYAAWRDVTPMHRELIEAMLACPAHLIATMRTKMGYVMEETEVRGKKKMTVSKVGLKPIQREGMEYEFDLVCDIDLEHIVTVSKTRCSAMDGLRAAKPSGSFIQPLIDWLNTGTQASSPPLPPIAPAAPPENATATGTVKLGGTVETNPYSQHEEEPCGEDMASRIKSCAQQLKLPMAKVAEFAPRCGVTKLAEIPYSQAMKLLAKLEDKVGDADCPF